LQEIVSSGLEDGRAAECLPKKKQNTYCHKPLNTIESISGDPDIYLKSDYTL